MFQVYVCIMSCSIKGQGTESAFLEGEFLVTNAESVAGPVCLCGVMGGDSGAADPLKDRGLRWGRGAREPEPGLRGDLGTSPGMVWSVGSLPPCQSVLSSHRSRGHV